MEKYVKEMEGTIPLPDRMRHSLLDFAKGIRVLVHKERQKQNPDDSLIAILCEAGRLGYRYLADLRSQSEQIAKEIVGAIPEKDIRDFSKTFVVATKASKPILDTVVTERFKQDEDRGEQNYDDLHWLGIFKKKECEMSKAILERGDKERVRTAIIQAAAVAVAWLECLEKREGNE